VGKKERKGRKKGFRGDSLGKVAGAGEAGQEDLCAEESDGTDGPGQKVGVGGGRGRGDADQLSVQNLGEERGRREER
jgi:hypothetical protein